MDKPPEGQVTACGLCGSPDLGLVLDMGRQPVAERYDTDETYPLELLRCGDCLLLQLSYIVPQHILFPAGHPYRTGNSRSLRDHYTRLAGGLSRNLGFHDTVVDIGASDGTFLDCYPGWVRRIAVEPTGQAQKCREKQITTYQEFFTDVTARKILSQHGKVKLVTACNVLAHVPDPHAFLDAVRSLLAPGGVFVTENHNADSVLTGLQVDTIYHEHLRYYSITTLSRLLAMHGLEVATVVNTAEHGGSLRVTAGLPVTDTASRAAAASVKLGNLCSALALEGAKIYGIGATTRATTLIHWAEIGNLVDCVCEVEGSQKIGHRIPGTQIPIVGEQHLYQDQPEYALILAWHLAKDIIPVLCNNGFKGKFIIPLPEPRIEE